MASHLVDRLETARRQRFVGRIAESDLFQSALLAAELPFYLLHVFGPGGVGKTSLLRNFVHIASRQGVSVAYLDGRNIEASPDAFIESLCQSMGLAPACDPGEYLSAQDKRYVLLVDTVELLTPLEGWLRDTFLPQLPANVLVVLAGRQPPSLTWRTDPGWQTMMRILPLRNLTSEESHAYMQKRQIPADQQELVLNFTHGHALALSLVADAFAQRPQMRFQPEEAPDIIKALLEQFVQKVPSPAHRAALEACALVRLTNESLLADMLKVTDAHEIFDWLRQLSFIDSERRGIFPHDLAREALTADLRWRNPDWYAELHRRARNYYMARLSQSDGKEQRRILSNYIFLHRDNPVVRPYFEWQESGSVFTDTLRPQDEAPLLAMVAQHEGESSAGLASHWLVRQPAGVSVLRHTSGEPQGFLVSVALEQVTPADREIDPAAEAAWNYLAQHAPLRPGEKATLFRFWMGRDSYQGVSPVQSRIFLNIIQHYLMTPGLAYTFLPCADPEFWMAIFTYADLTHVDGADFVVGGRRYTVFGHDWRTTPPMAWLGMMAEREMGASIAAASSQPSPVLMVLNETDFAEATREALRHFTDVAALRENPLIKSRLVVEQAGPGAGPVELAQTLKRLLEEAAETLQQSPRQAKFYRALYHTYLQPASTQEQAAELLDLPFSTYRRHLRSAIEQVTERLWQQELGGGHH